MNSSNKINAVYFHVKYIWTQNLISQSYFTELQEVMIKHKNLLRI